MFIKSLKLKISNALYVPGLCNNLLRVVQATSMGFKVVFTHQKCELYKNNELFLWAKKTGGLFVVCYVHDSPAGGSENHLENSRGVGLRHPPPRQPMHLRTPVAYMNGIENVPILV